MKHSSVKKILRAYFKIIKRYRYLYIFRIIRNKQNNIHEEHTKNIKETSLYKKT